MLDIDSLIHATEPWVVYRALIDLAGYATTDRRVVQAKQDLMAHPFIKSIVKDLAQWPGVVIDSHKSAGQLYHRLVFLADLGITKDDADFSHLEAMLMQSVSKEGLFRLPRDASPNHGVTAQKQWAWALCDAPLLIYAACKMGLQGDSDVHAGIGYLKELGKENGWPCVVSPELGNWRGPGRKSDPCPYATLIMLKLLTLSDTDAHSHQASHGIQCLLDCWENSLEQHPYMFFMGTDFRKLKAPFIWYDILHVMDVLSHYDEAIHDHRYHEMLALINSKVDPQGRFVPESVWMAWKGWDFGQKKIPSPWIAFLVERINQRSRHT
ncbi:MAG: hypothetical protein AB9828_04220 [Sphaerochaetaceae bacterium]